MTGDDDTRRAEESARRAVAAVWRIEAAKIVATLTRIVGDFSLAEDLAQDALSEALASWPQQGVPRNPAAWLTAVAKRRAIDQWRRDVRHRDHLAELAFGIDQRPPDALPWDPDAIDDDVVRLIFIACHPVLSGQAQVALTLRVVAGLTTDEIAAAFLTSTATVQQRIVRAKKTLADAAVGFEVPPREELPARMRGVLGVLYLLFTEGHSASHGEGWMRPDLAAEAIRLARILVALLPGSAEAHGLLALMELTAARFPARLDEHGDPILLEDQDRRRWDHEAIRRGRAALARAQEVGEGLGAYGLQAAIAECHAVAATVESTDWRRISVLYRALSDLTGSPVVELNRAVAVAYSDGPQAGLDLLDALRARDELAGHHLPHAVRGELLRRLGRIDEARTELEAAVAAVRNDSERRVLQRKLDDLRVHESGGARRDAGGAARPTGQ
ncbi:RNA polymerase sigma factor [Tessaracoccus sp. OS52]|uniref:RNA polymerase sigma factor n=1 Tax=Tessaracoccus sp. OS52 TaxID=2886691 RepID=UPI001D0FCD6A|nr:RNA polymerase sigma factor [Tessaracoccus sp. OS52]MCC2594353.1 RNA polymerase sigma factor [Tessaracoccus sp. OS52]